MAARVRAIAAAPSSDSESVRIRKIANGWIVSREGMKRGKYVQHEEYSAEKPQITTAKAGKR